MNNELSIQKLIGEKVILLDGTEAVVDSVSGNGCSLNIVVLYNDNNSEIKKTFRADGRQNLKQNYRAKRRQNQK